MEPIVTIIIPVGPGHERFLLAALESVRRQTLPVASVVVVNDTGRSLLVSDGVADVLDGGQRGVSHARNLGLERADTPFVSFLDADDQLTPQALEVSVKAYAAYREAGYVYGDYYVQRAGEPPQLQPSPTYNRRALAGGNLHPVTFLLPTRAAREVGGFGEFASWEDWDFCLKLAVAGWCGVRVPYPTLIYRLHTGQRREVGHAAGPELHEQVIAPYQARLLEEETLVGCCGGDAAARAAAQRIVGPVSTTAPETSGLIMMEFIGAHTGSIPFTTNPLTNTPFTQTYRGANNAHYRYVEAHPADVQGLEELGVWRRVVKPALDLPPPPVIEDVVELIGAPAANAGEAVVIKGRGGRTVAARSERAGGGVLATPIVHGHEAGTELVTVTPITQQDV